jgi:hypothetical protein
MNGDKKCGKLFIDRKNKNKHFQKVNILSQNSLELLELHLTK